VSIKFKYRFELIKFNLKTAILNTIDYVAKYRLEKENQVNVFKVPCIFPLLSKEKLIKDFDQMCHQIIEEKKLRLRLAVIDHISSATAVLFPIKELIEIVRKWTNYDTETLILIDGLFINYSALLLLHKIIKYLMNDSRFSIILLIFSPFRNLH